jgi:Alcohol dehydrogenase GroES-like domain
MSVAASTNSSVRAGIGVRQRSRRGRAVLRAVQMIDVPHAERIGLPTSRPKDNGVVHFRRASTRQWTARVHNCVETPYAGRSPGNPSDLLASVRPAQIREVPKPAPGPGQVLIKVGGAGVCHSDLHVLDDLGFKPPSLLGMRTRRVLSGSENGFEWGSVADARLRRAGPHAGDLRDARREPEDRDGRSI